MKKIVSGFVAFLLVFVNVGQVFDNIGVFLEANNELTITNNESNRLEKEEVNRDVNVSDETKNIEEEVEIKEQDERTNEKNKTTTNNVLTEKNINEKSDKKPLALITLRGSVTYEAGNVRTSDSILADVDLDLLGLPIVSLGVLDLSHVNFGVPGTYQATGLALGALGITLAEIVIDVHIIDTIAPVITGNTSVSYPVGTNVSTNDFLTAANIHVTDNASAVVLPTVDLSSVNFNTSGIYPVSVHARDSSGNNAIPFVVNVIIGDVISPVITGSLSVSYTRGVSRTENQFIGDANIHVTDNSGETITPSVDLSNVNFNQVGIYTAVVHAKDSAGNQAVPFNVTVNIVAPPTGLINASLDVYYEAGSDIDVAQFIIDANIEVLDLLGVAADPLVSLGTVDFDTVGVYPVIATAVSLLGIPLATVTINVHIVDTTAPVITGNTTVSFPVGANVSTNEFITAANIQVHDNATGAITPAVNLNAVDFNTAGTYTAVVTALDASGNMSLPFNVNVIIGDIIPPVIAGDLSVSYVRGVSRTENQFIADANIHVTDNSGETITPSVDLSNVNFNQVGIYTAVVHAKDSAGNQAVPFNVTVNIVAPPTGLINASLDVYYEAGSDIDIAQFIIDANIEVLDLLGVAADPLVSLGTVDFDTVGVYPVIATAVSLLGIPLATVTINVHIIDTTAPVIHANTEITYEVGSDIQETQFLLDVHTSVTDNTDEVIVPSVDLSNVNFNQVGTYQATITAHDSSGNQAMPVVITVNVHDTISPTITGDNHVVYEVGLVVDEMQFLADTHIVATDNSGETITPMVDLSSVDFNQLGTYTVNVSATDSAGNTTNFAVKVDIVDTVVPVIKIVTNNLTYEIGTILTPEKIITDGGITVSDNSGENITPAIDLNAVDTNAVGIYTAVVHALDGSGNVATENIIINIIDTVGPVITGNNSMSYELGSVVSIEQFLEDAHIGVSDNSGETIMPTVDLSNVDFNIAGTYTATVSATDHAGNTTTFPVEVIITDTTLPIIHVTESDITYEIGTVLTAEQVIEDSHITVTDNSGEVIFPTVDLSSVNTNVVGTYPVVITAEDSSGNKATANITIHIVDTTGPVITGDNNITYEAGTLVNEAQFLADAHVVVTDNSGEIITPSVDLSGVDFNNPGTYTVDVTATDTMDNTTIFPIQIVIVDTTGPIITGNEQVSYPLGAVITEAQFLTDANIVVTDNSGEIITPVVDLSGIDFNTAGTYIATIKATDNSGNETLLNVVVTIGDVVPPVITGSPTVTYIKGVSRSESQFLTDANIVVTDNSGEIIVPSVDLSHVNFNQIGSYQATVNARDITGNNAIPLNVEVIIIDLPEGLITANGDVYYEAGSDIDVAQFIIDANIDVLDLLGVAADPLINLGTVDFDTVGVYPVVATAVNLDGNALATANINVHIIDTTNPVITADSTISYDVGTNVSQSQFLMDVHVHVTDNTDEVIEPSADLSDVDFNTMGEYSVMIHAEDSSGNHATPFTVVVTITDMTAPIIDITTREVTYEVGTVLTSEQVIVDGNITVTDNSGTVIIPSVDLSSVNTNIVGTYTAEVSAEDSSGNKATADITIHIVDTSGPVITGDNRVSYEAGTAVSDAQFLADAHIVVTDNSGEAITPSVDLSDVDFNTAGTYTAIVRATDNAGNTTVFPVEVVITDTTAPVITGDNRVSYEAGTTVSDAQFLADAHIVVTDNSGEAITPSVDLSDVDFNTAGTYTAIVRATDNAGNTTVFPVEVVITDTTAPVITGDNRVSYEAGTTVSDAQFLADAHIVVTDNSGAVIIPIVDLSDVDFNTAGTYTVTVSAMDDAGNTTTFPVEVVITDTTAPVIDITTREVTYEVGTVLTSEQVIVDGNITVTDNSGTVIIPSVDLSNVNTNVAGTYRAEVSAEDSSGNKATADITIHIVDTSGPVITGDNRVSYEAGTTVSDAQFLTDAHIVVTDNSGEAITPSVDLSAVDFNTAGTYTAIVSATDDAGNTTTFLVEVVITDTTAPVIDITTREVTYEVGTVLTSEQVIVDGNITVTDNSGTVIIPSVDLSSVNTNIVGTYIAEVSAEDSSGNKATADITIHIVDTSGPVITGDNRVSYEAGTTVSDVQFLTDAHIVVTDNSGETITPSVDLSNVDFNTPGTYTAIVSATDDAGNTTTFPVEVVITDTTAPVIDITTREVTYEVGTVLTSEQVIVDGNITVTDNSGTVIIPSVDLSNVNTNIVGTYSAEVSAEDSSGNKATADITIHIVDTSGPVITGDNRVSYEAGTTVSDAQFLTDAHIVVTDNSGETIISTVDLSDVDFNTAGTYTAIVSATDDAGNTTVFPVEVVITDTTAPIIDITTREVTYEVGTVLTSEQVIEDGNITVTDNSGTVIIPSVDLSSVNMNVVGTYRAEVSAEDSSGNKATTDITIHIVDRSGPVITGDNRVSYEAGTTVSDAQFLTDAHIVVTDNSGEAITPSVDLSNVDFNTPGTYTAIVSATDDAGNTTTFPVQVVITNDNVLPIINMRTANLTYEIGTSLTSEQVINDAGVSATDNSGAEIEPHVDISTVNTNMIGTYSAEVSAEDSSGNKATADITIHIVDTIAPIISGDRNASYYVAMDVTPTQFLENAHIIVTDNSGETITPTVDLSRVNFDVVGGYTATVYAEDSSGNEATPFNISVAVNPAPILRINIVDDELTYEVGTDLTPSIVGTDGGITVTYNSDLTMTSSIDLTNVNTDVLGTYTAVVTADDSYGNHETAMVTIHIVDTQAPVITGDNSIDYLLDMPVNAGQFLSNANIVVADNYDNELTPTVDLSAVDFNTVGPYMAFVHAEDSSGNATTYNVTVNIVEIIIDITTASLEYEIGTPLTESQVLGDGHITVIASNNVHIEPTIDLSSVDVHEVGIYTAMVSATLPEPSTAISLFAHNQSVTKEVIIEIDDTIAPVITVERAVLSYPMAFSLTAQNIIDDAGVVVIDNSGDQIAPIINLASVNTNAIGTYSIQIQAIDEEGNAAIPVRVDINIVNSGQGQNNGQRAMLATTGDNQPFHQYILAILLILGNTLILLRRRRKAEK